jgi:Trk K+ transport system NAD-binding subunit
MSRNRFVIIGLGNIGLELIEKLSKDLDILCIDIDPESEETAKQIRGDVGIMIGDATSRLILEKAGVDDADVIIITTTEEKVNLEIASILKEHFDVNRVISIGLTKENMERLIELGVEVEGLFSASATGIRNRLEQKSRTAHAIGLGKDEILEVELHPNSRLANKPVSVLAPIRWKIGLIYRDDNIIVPRRDTVLKPKDRVVILGDPGVLKTVSEILSFSFQQFPLEYGSTVIAYLTGKEGAGFFNELDYIFSMFPLKRLLLVSSKEATDKSDIIQGYLKKDNLKNIEMKDTTLPFIGALEHAFSEVNGDQGLIVISKKAFLHSFSPFLFDSRKRRFLHSLTNFSFCPTLLSMETTPYDKVVVPGIEGVNIQSALETSLEIASSVNNEVTAAVMKPSKYIAGDEEFAAFQEKEKTISEISLMYKYSVGREVLDGNPIKVLTGYIENHNLLILDTSGWRKRTWIVSLLNPDVVWHIIRKSPISTLLLPPLEESL